MLLRDELYYGIMVLNATADTFLYHINTHVQESVENRLTFYVTAYSNNLQ